MLTVPGIVLLKAAPGALRQYHTLVLVHALTCYHGCSCGQLDDWKNHKKGCGSKQKDKSKDDSTASAYSWLGVPKHIGGVEPYAPSETAACNGDFRARVESCRDNLNWVQTRLLEISQRMCSSYSRFTGSPRSNPKASEHYWKGRPDVILNKLI